MVPLIRVIMAAHCVFFHKWSPNSATSIRKDQKLLRCGKIYIKNKFSENNENILKIILIKISKANLKLIFCGPDINFVIN